MFDHSLLRSSGWLLLCLFLLFASGIYSHMSWNLAFIGCVLILIVPLLYLSKPSEAKSATAEKEDKPKQIYLVVGPYAVNWFASQRNADAIRYDNTTVWFAARDALELSRLLNRFLTQEDRGPIILFFPLLPDGHDTTALTCESLLSWQKTLQTLVLSEPLPCILALYIRCSQQRVAHDPDCAIWSELTFPAGENLELAISALIIQLGKQAIANEGYQLQRQITLAMLQQWMKETTLLPILNGLLNSSSVQLRQIMLADYGNGFIRHGAWSRWLEDTYAILPALAKNRIEFPLPELVPSESLVKECVPAPRLHYRYLLLSFITLMLAGTMYGAFMWESKRHTTVTELVSQVKRLPGDDIEGQFAVVRQLEKLKPQLVQCADSYPFQNWGFSHCPELLSEVENLLEKYEHWTVFSSANTPSLFASGNAQLIPAQDYRLLPAASLIEKNPTITFLIVGHSDNSGDEKNNLSLSTARARAVRDWIVTQTSVPVERLHIKGMGDALPLFSNDTPEGKEMNRRVEIIPLR
ncbi:hypothetical protein C9426_31640 [Serratia sp. S1B]|nr:hypothetical protein C9426_31640 [Serratia sp. S1B]